jgi:hypothetical protein
VFFSSLYHHHQVTEAAKQNAYIAEQQKLIDAIEKLQKMRNDIEKGYLGTDSPSSNILQQVRRTFVYFPWIQTFLLRIMIAAIVVHIGNVLVCEIFTQSIIIFFEN